MCCCYNVIIPLQALPECLHTAVLSKCSWINTRADILISHALHHLPTSEVEAGSNHALKTRSPEIQIQLKPPPTASQKGSHGWGRILDTSAGSVRRYGKRAAGFRDQEETQRLKQQDTLPPPWLFKDMHCTTQPGHTDLLMLNTNLQ